MIARPDPLPADNSGRGAKVLGPQISKLSRYILNTRGSIPIFERIFHLLSISWTRKESVQSKKEKKWQRKDMQMFHILRLGK